MSSLCGNAMTLGEIALFITGDNSSEPTEFEYQAMGVCRHALLASQVGASPNPHPEHKCLQTFAQFQKILTMLSAARFIYHPVFRAIAAGCCPARPHVQASGFVCGRSRANFYLPPFVSVDGCVHSRRLRVASSPPRFALLCPPFKSCIRCR